MMTDAGGGSLNEGCSVLEQASVFAVLLLVIVAIVVTASDH